MICSRDPRIGTAVRRWLLAPLVILCLSGSTLSGRFAYAQHRTETLAETGMPAPDNNGTFSSFIGPAINDSGQAMFSANLEGTSGGASDDNGIFRGSGGGTTQIAREGQAAPDNNGTFSVLNAPVFNDLGQAAFFATLSGTSGGANDNSGIFRGSGGAITQIARENQTAPDSNGTFSGFGFLTALNDSGQVAFFAALTGTSGGASDNSGIFRGSGGTITQIARENQTAPDSNGQFSSFNLQVLNDSGATAFLAILRNTSGGSDDDSGIFRGSGGAITQIARENQTAPDGNGQFSGFGSPALNNSGAAAFLAVLRNTSGGSDDDTGIFRGSGGAITQIARENQTAPDGNGQFLLFDSPALNDSGVAAFRGSLRNTGAGSDDNQGIYLGDGVDLIQVARKGEIVDGSAITSVFFNSGSDDRSGLNRHGQVAYRASLADGRQLIQRFTPDLHWRATFSSNWDSSSRWTLGLTPAHVHDIFIDPAASLTVFGPIADTSVRSLQIGGGSGLATLNLRNGTVLAATNGATIQSTGILTGDGTIAGDVTNNGTILANNITVASTLINNHIMRGHGRVHANLMNAASGRIRALGGDQLWLSGPSFTNAGLVEVNGAELQIDAPVLNQIGTGLISLRNNGSLIADAGIDNQGSMAMTQGSSSIQAKINNTGIIQVSGGAHATFFDDVTQNGTLQVSHVGNTNSVAVLLGDFSGSGGFVGGGDVFALGDLRPGNSAASVLFDGNLFLGASTETFIELGGLEIGEFDQLAVTGDLNLAGDLFVDLIDGHTLRFNQQYLIADIGGSRLGQFNGLGEGDLVGSFGGMDLFISYAAGSGNGITLFTAVPEPSAALFLVIGWAMVVSQCRRR